MSNVRSKKMEEIVNYCRQYGFIFQGSEIYGGLANTWDYGPLGVRLKNNIKDSWRYHFIQNMANSFELDADILMNPKVWEASGHVSSFSDPLVDCKECKTRHRADNLIDGFDPDAHADGMSKEQMNEYIKEHKIPCPKCGKSNFTEIRDFNLMFETNRGVIKDDKSIVYLRPENAQGEYVNYLNVLRAMRASLPFAIGQIGKAFRNEITPGNFTFRTIEFEQMEYQVFCKPGNDEELYEYFKEYAKKYFMSLGIPEDKLRYHDHEKLAHYAKKACDIEYLFPFGWGEINGTHNRTDFDLTQHQKFSRKKLEYFDQKSNEKYIPYIIESTVGADRLFLALICESLKTEELANGETRDVLKINPNLAPIKFSILPLEKKKHSEKAISLYQKLQQYYMCTYDEAGNMGKRYRRSDAIGVPYSICVDDATLEKDTVTIRDRDTMKQIVVPTDEITDVAEDKLILRKRLK